MTKKIKTILPFIIISFILALLNFTGSYLTARSGLLDYPVQSTAKLIVVLIIQIIIYTILLSVIVYLFNNKIKMSDRNVTEKKYTCFVSLMVMWLPALIAYYPAIYSYDAEVQLEQWINGRFDVHHPLIHTLIMGFCYEYIGIVAYTLLQMAVLAFALNKAYGLLSKVFVARWIRITYILFFGLFPFFPIMSVCMTKDVMFAAFYIWLVTILASVLIFKEDFSKKIAEFLVVSVLLMLFRNNGVYTLITLLIALLLYKARPKKLLLTTFISIIAYYIILSAMTFITGAEHGEKKEMLSIPLQQLARTYQSHSEEMSADDLEEIYYYLPQNGCAHYHPRLSDPVKMHFNEEHYSKNPSGFWKCYFKNMKSHPDSYVMAALYLTMGNWCPEDISHIYVYSDWWKDRVNYVMTDVTPVFDDEYLKKTTILPLLTNYYELFATDVIQYKIPVFRELFIPATYNIILILILLLSLRKKMWNMVVLIMPSLAYLGTCLLGPGVVTRYSLPLIITVPFFLVILGLKIKENQVN